MFEVTADGLNTRYMFDNFVVAGCNSFAHAVAWQIAMKPGDSYNPLLIHAKPGLGKTHLMQAIGHEFRKAHPRSPMLYCMAEDYLNEVVKAIRENATAELRRKYRHVKLWMLDDVRFFWDVNAPVTEEEFFHTLGDLLLNGGQVVMCSEVPPKKLPILNSRLRDRMESGILADLRMPEFETRVQILEKKLETAEGEVSSSIIEYLARKVDSNVRVLEGTLLKLCAYQTHLGSEITQDMVDDVVSDYTTTYERIITPGEIVELVAERMNISFSDLVRTGLGTATNLPRQIAMYLVRKLTNLSAAEIGVFFGGRSGPTVSVSVGKIEQMMLKDQDLRARIGQMKSDIQEHRP